MLKRNGFQKIRSDGGHIIYTRNPDEVIPVAHHNPNRMICERIIKTFNLR